MTAGAESSETRNRRNKSEAKVVMPDKGSCRSQYVVRKKAMQEKEEKAEHKAKTKKKFINMSHNTKKFNGVIVGSDHVIKNNNNEFESEDNLVKVNGGEATNGTDESWHASAIK